MTDLQHGELPAETSDRLTGLPDCSRILTAVADALEQHGSDLVADGVLDTEFERQARSILAEAAAALAAPRMKTEQRVSADFRRAATLAGTGRLRAAENRDPAESLLAAELLFDVALAPLSEWATALPLARTPLEAAAVLHHAIFRRFPAGAIAYAQTMRERLSAAHQESRLRLSRDLHDRVAHGIAAGLQRIELSGSHDPDLSAAAAVLRATLSDVQALALDLRQLVGDRTLDQAISDYADDTSAVPPVLQVVSRGRSRQLPPSTAEELFMIAREAIRNARTHARGAARILVQLDWGVSVLRLSISDDGAGFSHEDVATGSIGLLDMRERADAVGAVLAIETAAHPGTVVGITLPLDDGSER